MKNKIIVHADDLGLSESATNGVLKAHDQGFLNSVSLLPNGKAFDYALREVVKRPDLRLSVHLNLLEGPSISKKEQLKLLVDDRGNFFHTFFTLWRKHLLSDQKGKVELRQQVKIEMKAQIVKVFSSLGQRWDINVDSHNHVHMIPFVFDALMEIAKEMKINFVRIPKEPFFLYLKNKDSISKYAGLNLVKHCLLNVLSKDCKTRLNSAGIETADYFIGVLFTGFMTEGVVKKALKILMKKGLNKKKVEILFHPGRARVGELQGWVGGRRFDEYYCSQARDLELNELLREQFKETIRSFEFLI